MNLTKNEIETLKNKFFAVLVGDCMTASEYVAFDSEKEADDYIQSENKIFHSQFTERDYELGDAPEYVLATFEEFKDDYQERFERYIDELRG